MFGIELNHVYYQIRVRHTGSSLPLQNVNAHTYLTLRMKRTMPKDIGEVYTDHRGFPCDALHHLSSPEGVLGDRPHDSALPGATPSPPISHRLTNISPKKVETDVVSGVFGRIFPRVIAMAMEPILIRSGLIFPASWGFRTQNWTFWEAENILFPKLAISSLYSPLKVEQGRSL